MRTTKCSRPAATSLVEIRFECKGLDTVDWNAMNAMLQRDGHSLCVASQLAMHQARIG